MGAWHNKEKFALAGGVIRARSPLSCQQPSFSVPQFVLSKLLKRDAKELIDRLRQEIAR